jgi:acetoin utilization deacetylase AcuC-like enzyme
VHHGNGTQEIVECAQKPRVFREKAATSILWDNDARQSTQYRPWFSDEDGKNILFSSVHLYGRGFYPKTGEDDGDDQEPYRPGGIYNLPLRPGRAAASTWRKQFSDTVIPALTRFEPDFILISAGFDAHEKDHLHDSDDTRVTEFEYEWVTKQLIGIANRFCDGRLVSVLEGGYCSRAGPLSPLASSVVHHVRALVNTDEKPLVMDPDDAAYFVATEADREKLN